MARLQAAARIGEGRMKCKYKNCGECEDHPRHDFKTINMPISLSNHKFKPAEPTTPYKPYVTELVKDHGPRIDTVPFPPVAAAKTSFERILDNAAEALKKMPQHLRRPEMRAAPTQVTENSSFIRPASLAESMDMDKAAAQTTPHPVVISTVFKAPAVEPQKCIYIKPGGTVCGKERSYKEHDPDSPDISFYHDFTEAGSTRPEMAPFF